MNGTRGVVRQIVYAPGTHPNHDELSQRMPTAIIVDFPGYAGPSFYDEPERATWVPLRPVERETTTATKVSRAGSFL